jgi:branched-chain amino acid transport system ATP-binding protein
MQQHTSARTGGVAIAMFGVTAEYFPGQAILTDLTITAQPGRITVILGPNGSGKSTSLRVLAGLIRLREGRIEMRTEEAVSDISALPAHDRPRRRIAYLPQGHSLFPAMSVHDNLLVGAWPIRRDRRAVADALGAIYERYPFLHGKRRAMASSLSGGQQRILEVARLLVCDPAVILVDEPSAGVAPAIASTMYDELSRMRDEGRTVVLVDQDLRPALAIADMVYTLRSGRNDRSGPAEEFSADASELVRDWLAVRGAGHVEPSP